MFKKYKYNHPRIKCKTGKCEFKSECKQSYKYCNEKTGFVTPCESCIYIIDGCRTFNIACYRQKPIIDCPKWEKQTKNHLKVATTILYIDHI